MKHKSTKLLLSAAAVGISAVYTHAAVFLMDTAFTYQGRLEKDGAPVTDTCGFQFTLLGDGGPFDPVLVSGVEVENGLFTVQVDFGEDVFNGLERSLEIEVMCTGDPDFTLLGQREITPTPYALALPGLWTQQNDKGQSPNLIGGYYDNIVSPGVVGATIGGDGQSGAANNVVGDYGTIGGGEGNTASNSDSTVSGGGNNAATGWQSTIAGGVNNTATGSNCTVSGGLTTRPTRQHVQSVVEVATPPTITTLQYREAKPTRRADWE